MTEIIPNTPETSKISSRDQTQWVAQGSKNAAVYSKANLIAIGLLFLVVSITGFLYARVASLEAERSDIAASIAADQTAIDTLKAKPELVAAELFKNNKTALAAKIDKSNAANYIREFERIQSEDNNLILSGFSFGADKITTSATSLKGVSDDAINRIISFIRGYRENSVNSASGSLAKFDLKSIQSVTGKSDKRSINIEFSIQ